MLERTVKLVSARPWLTSTLSAAYFYLSAVNSFYWLNVFRVSPPVQARSVESPLGTWARGRAIAIDSSSFLLAFCTC